MSKNVKCGIQDLFGLFEEILSPADVLSAKLMTQISGIITKERIKRHMTQSEFAGYLNVTQSQISRWEHGDYNFSLEKIADIAAKLNLDVNISAVDISIYRALEAYGNEHSASPQPFSFVFQNPEHSSLNRVYHTDSLKPVISNIKEESNYVTVR